MNREFKNVKKQNKGREKRQILILSSILLLGIFLLLPFVVKQAQSWKGSDDTSYTVKAGHMSDEVEEQTLRSKEPKIPQTEAVTTVTETDETITEESAQETETETEKPKTTEEKLQEISEREHLYPEELLEMLEKNIETIDFVLDYPTKKNRVYTDYLEEDFEKGDIPLLLQWDERWGYGNYGNNIVAVSGCGPTCMAMVIAGLTGNRSVTPYTMAEYSQEHDFVTAEGNTAWAFITDGGVEFGVKGQPVSLEETLVTEKLKQGVPIICSMRPGDFTTSGHFIVLTGVQNGKIELNDPNSLKNSEALWNFSDLAPQIKNLWEMSLTE